MAKTKIQLEEILDEVSRCRSRVLDDCELELGDSPRWKPLRARLLKVFGERGLEGKIVEIFKADFESEGR